MSLFDWGGHLQSVDEKMTDVGPTDDEVRVGYGAWWVIECFSSLANAF